jgi:hypothetical protein
MGDAPEPKYSKKPSEKKGADKKTEKKRGSIARSPSIEIAGEQALYKIVLEGFGESAATITCLRASTVAEAIERICTKAGGEPDNYELVERRAEKGAPTLRCRHVLCASANHTRPAVAPLAHITDIIDITTLPSDVMLETVLSGFKDSKSFIAVRRLKKAPRGEAPPIKDPAGKSASLLHAFLLTCAARFTHANVVNDPDFADVEFYFSKGSKSLYAHKSILALYDINISKFGKDTKGSFKVDASASNFTPFAIEQMLIYIYSGTVDLGSMKALNLIDLIVTAWQFKQDHLRWYAVDALRKALSLSNIYPALTDVFERPRDVQSSLLLPLCMEFIDENFVEFVSDQKGIEAIGLPIFHKVVETHVKHATPSYVQFHAALPPQARFQSAFVDAYGNREQTGADVVLAPVDSRTLLMAHRVLLGSISSKMKEKIVDQTRAKSSTIKPLGLGLTTGATEALLRFAYYGDKNVAPEFSFELCYFCKHYDVPELFSSCEEILLRGPTVESAVGTVLLCNTPKIFSQDVATALKNEYYPFIAKNLAAISLKKFLVEDKKERKHNIKVVIDVLEAYQRMLGSSGVSASSSSGRLTSRRTRRATRKDEKEDGSESESKTERRRKKEKAEEVDAAKPDVNPEGVEVDVEAKPEATEDEPETPNAGESAVPEAATKSESGGEKSKKKREKKHKGDELIVVRLEDLES